MYVYNMYFVCELTPIPRAMPMALQRMACQQPRERKQMVMATAKMMAGRPYSEFPERYTVCTVVVGCDATTTVLADC